MLKPDTVLMMMTAVLAGSIASPLGKATLTKQPVSLPSRSLSFDQLAACWQATKKPEMGGLGLGGGLLCYQASKEEGGKLGLVPADADVTYARPAYQRVEIADDHVVIGDVRNAGLQKSEKLYTAGMPMPRNVRPTLDAATRLQAVIFRTAKP